MDLRRSPLEIIFCSGYSVGTGSDHGDPLFGGRVAVAFFSAFVLGDAYDLVIRDSRIEDAFAATWPIQEQITGKFGALGPDRALRFLTTLLALPFAYLTYGRQRAQTLFSSWDFFAIRKVRVRVLALFLLLPAPYLITGVQHAPLAVLAFHVAVFFLVWLAGAVRK